MDLEVLEEMIIAIEGSDGSGKGTQSKLLHEYFTKNKIKSELISFPAYDTPTGIKIKAYLKEEITMSTMEFAKLQYEDKLAQKKRVEGLVKNGSIVIFDRYKLSNVVYPAAKYKEPKRSEVIDEINNWMNNLTPVDIGIFLDLPLRISDKRTEERSRGKDKFEKDTNFMGTVYKVYKKLSKKENYIIINCVDENGQQKSRKDIHREILYYVKPRISSNA